MTATADTWLCLIHHTSHSEASTHTCVKDHSLEFPVSTEANEDCHQVIDRQHNNHALCELLVSSTLGEILAKGTCLYPEADCTEVSEKVY